MMKQLSPNILYRGMEEPDTEHYPGWVKSLVWLSVILFGLLFWAAVFSLLFALYSN